MLMFDKRESFEKKIYFNELYNITMPVTARVMYTLQGDVIRFVK